MRAVRCRRVLPAMRDSRVAAVPTPTLEGVVRITRRFAFAARAEYLKVSHNGSSGSATDLHADLQFRWVPNFAIGAGYSLLRLNVNSVDMDNPEAVNIRQRGPEAFIRVSF